MDALRGIAALVVAFHHSSFAFMPVFRRHLVARVDTGTYGILVFFLVSGYIIPASLERTGSLRGFWVSRIFRIYPLYLVAVGVTLLLAVLGVKPIRGDLEKQSIVSAVFGHMTLLQDLLHTPNIINVLWTLSYEMVFYLLVAALFMVGLHRRSSLLAISLAMVGVVLGGVLPTVLLTRHLGMDTTVVLVTAIIVICVVGSVRGRDDVRTVSAVLASVLALILVTTNGRIPPGEGVAVLAVMFAGTVVYRAQHGQISRWIAVVSCGAVLCCTTLTGIWYGDGGQPWASAVLLAAATFAIGWVLRGRELPGWLTRLGLVSYSIYLLHPVLLMVTDGTIGRWQQDNPAVEAGFLAILIPLCLLTHEFVEVPAQRWGRTLTRRLRSKEIQGR